MSFDRNNLPEPIGYFEAQGVNLTGRGKWKTGPCTFHGGSDSLRANVASGAWACMACGEKGGDVLAFHMKAHGLEFVDACKALGAWIEDGRPAIQTKPTPLPARAALQVLAVEANLVAVAAGNVAHGVALTPVDLSRVLTASGRITRLVEVFA